MTWSYTTADLDTSTAAGQINVVRFLLGDTDTTDQQVQNEEITFALSQTGDNCYYAAAYCAGTLASKYSRFVNTDLDGALAEDFSDLAKSYRKLASQLRSDGQKYSGGTLGVKVGGVSYTAEDLVRANTDRPASAFPRDQFRIDAHFEYE